MSTELQNAKIEIGVYSLFTCVSVSVFINAMSLPASTREPLGSATLPQIVSVIVIGLSGLLALRALGVLRRANAAAKDSEEPSAGDPAATVPDAPRKRYDRAVLLLVYAIVYVGVLEARSIPSEYLTPVFIGMSMWTLLGFNRTSLPLVILLASVVGYATSEIFKQIFYINLP